MLGVGTRELMGRFSDFVTITYDSFTTTLVVHFMVRLQEAARPTAGSACFGSVTGTLQFARADVDYLARAEREGNSGGDGEARGVRQSARSEELEMDVVRQGSTVPSGSEAAEGPGAWE